MTIAERQLPTDCAGWQVALQSGTFPSERIWIEFKQQLVRSPRVSRG
jgi:hypothetical protein